VPSSSSLGARRWWPAGTGEAAAAAAATGAVREWQFCGGGCTLAGSNGMWLFIPAAALCSALLMFRVPMHRQLEHAWFGGWCWTSFACMQCYLDTVQLTSCAPAALSSLPYVPPTLRGFTPYSRDDYIQWKKEGRLVSAGVHAQVRVEGCCRCWPCSLCSPVVQLPW
jgi:hypothetical protein